MDPNQPEEMRTPLKVWNDAIDRLLGRRQAAQALPLLQVLLKSVPRHLPTYFRLLQAIWVLQRWDEGHDWALRLLRADPCNELAWSVLANGAESSVRPSLAREHWTRAFELAPYNRPIRRGVNRTSLGRSHGIGLNRPSLATLYRLGGRWERAAELYRQLVDEEPNRLDFLCCHLEALWRGGMVTDALALARSLARRQPSLLIPWLICDHEGDEDDRALAQAYVAALDLDGEYTWVRFGVGGQRSGHDLMVSWADARQLGPFASDRGGD